MALSMVSVLYKGRLIATDVVLDGLSPVQGQAHRDRCRSRWSHIPGRLLTRLLTVHKTCTCTVPVTDTAKHGLSVLGPVDHVLSVSKFYHF
jgi:hypothetical protein